MEASKSSPAPLDAYETAKPDEPIFVLQGGDPLAAPLVRIWAYLARVRAGLSGDATMIDAPIYVAKTTSVEHDPEECKNLLVRATAAEQVSWHMDGYRRGEINQIAEIQKINSLERLDFYDICKRMQGAISNSISTINDYREELRSRGFVEHGDSIDFTTDRSLRVLKSLSELVENRRVA